MTDQRDKASSDPAAHAAEVAGSAANGGISRRALLRGASVAAPAILTLNSNAALGWAITSGTIGTTMPTDPDASTTCLIDGVPVSDAKPGVYYTKEGGAYLREIRADYLYSWTDKGTEPMRPPEACAATRSFYYSPDGGANWFATDPPGGEYGGAVLSFSTLATTSFNLGEGLPWPHV